MPRRSRRRKKQEEEYTFLGIRVSSYQAGMDASINHDAYNPQYAFNLDERDPLYRFITRLLIIGAATWPEDRAGDIYEVTLYGDEAPSRNLNATLDDVHARDEHGSRQYRTYRGKRVPVYKPPSGIGLLYKVRGEKRWTAWINAPPRLASDMLTLLASGTQLYMALTEVKRGRRRWVTRFTLQTTDPAEE